MLEDPRTEEEESGTEEEMAAPRKVMSSPEALTALAALSSPEPPVGHSPFTASRNKEPWTWVPDGSLRCAHASRGGTFRSCRLTGCIARTRGITCTLAMDTSGAVSHDVGSEETVVMKNRLTVVNLQMMQLNTTCLTSRLAVWSPDCSAPVA